MNAQERARLRREMAQAVMLPADDPLRRRVARRVREAGDWAGAQWLELIELHERLGLDLSRVTIPDGLEDRLLSIAEQSPRPARPARWRAVGAVMACALLAVLVWAGGWGLGAIDSAGVAESALRRIVQQATADYQQPSMLSIRSSDRLRVQDALSRSSPLPVRLPVFEADYQLEGGRVCRFGEMPVIYTRWVRNGEPYALYQFRLADAGLPAGAALPHPGAIGLSDLSSQTERIAMWADDLCGYALVYPEGEKPPAARNDSGL